MASTPSKLSYLLVGALLIGACNKDRSTGPDGSSVVDAADATDGPPNDADAAVDTGAPPDTRSDADMADTAVRDSGSETGHDVDGGRDGATDATVDAGDAVGDARDTEAVTDGDATSDGDANSDADATTPSDPFDPASCSGSAWSASSASSRLGSKDSEILDAKTVMERHRTCSNAGCGAWSTPEKADIRLLTYSGGVTTRYTTRQVDTSLVLYEEAGTPKLSVRHDTHLTKYPDAHDEGITFGFPPMVEPYPTLKVWNTMPQHSSDYRDLENYLGRDAEMFATDHCARFESVLPGRDEEITHEYVAVYRF